MSKLRFHRELQQTDPHQSPVLIVGQQRHLSDLSFDQVRCKLEPRVSLETFTKAITYLHPAPTDTCSLYLDLAKVAALPTKASRHNSESRAHALTKLVQTNTSGVNESIVVVCEKDSLFASGCAVARAYPLYNRKTSKVDGAAESVTVNVEFVLVGGEELSEQDIRVIEYAARGIRLTAKIVDAPCNEMNVSGFLKEIETVAKELKLVPKVSIVEKDVVFYVTYRVVGHITITIILHCV